MQQVAFYFGLCYFAKYVGMAHSASYQMKSMHVVNMTAPVNIGIAQREAPVNIGIAQTINNVRPADNIFLVLHNMCYV